MRPRDVEFAEFAASRVDRLLALAYLLTGNHHSAEDLVQEVLIKAHRRWSRVLAADDADAYVRRMLVDEHISWRRRRSSTELPFEQAPEGREMGRLDDSVVARDWIWRMLATLPARQRAVLVLRHYENLADRDIADLVGCADATVRSLAARGLSALRCHPDLADHVAARREETS